MKISLAFLLLLFCPLLIFSQRSISGVVVDSISQKPLSHATVYIDGTTIGTITDGKGCFVMNGIPIPARLVISHIKYQPKTVLVGINQSGNLLIELQERVFNLSEVKVLDKNLRQKNLDIFKRLFLGSDDWGQKAILNNDSVLKFKLDYKDRKMPLNEATKKAIKTGSITQIYEVDEDSAFIIFKELAVFKAIALAPLSVDLPLLGYRLRIDLVDFTVQYSESQILCKFVGYYYFQPSDDRRVRAKQIEKNRESVYYNSTQHFLRSLYNDALEQNGYRLGLLKESQIKGFRRFSPVNINERITYQPDGQMLLTGLRDSTYKIIFYSKVNGFPLNLKISKENAYRSSESDILFLSDSCRVNKDGIVPNSDVVFGGVISKKKVGTFLPNDYVVVTKNDLVLPVKVP